MYKRLLLIGAHWAANTRVCLFKRFLGLQYVLRGDECEDWAQHPKRHAEVCRVSWLSALNGVGGEVGWGGG